MVEHRLTGFVDRFFWCSQLQNADFTLKTAREFYDEATGEIVAQIDTSRVAAAEVSAIGSDSLRERISPAWVLLPQRPE